MLLQSAQNLLNMPHVLTQCSSKDEDVIQIYHHKRIGERPQYILHHHHESCCGICQSKGHEHPFKETFFGLEGSLSYISLLYWDLVVARLQINLIEVFFLLDLVKEIINSWNLVPVPDYDFI